MISQEYYDIYETEFQKRHFRKYYNMWCKKYEKITVFFKIRNLKSPNLYWVFLGITLNCDLVNNRPNFNNMNSLIIYFRLQFHHYLEQKELLKILYPDLKNISFNDHCLNPYNAIYMATEFFNQISTTEKLIHYIDSTNLFSDEKRNIALNKILNAK